MNGTSPSKGPYQDYFSIDSILSTEPRVYARFLVRGHTLGHLDPLASSQAAEADKENDSSLANTSPPPPPGRDLSPGRRVALPWWLVHSLSQLGAIDIVLPRCYGQRVRNDLIADASNVSLASKCRHYYTLGLHVAAQVREKRVVDMLLLAFGERIWAAVDAAAYGSAEGKGADAMRRLEQRERDIFYASHGVCVALGKWKERRVERIGISRQVLGKRSAQGAGLRCSPLTPKSRLN